MYFIDNIVCFNDNVYIFEMKINSKNLKKFAPQSTLNLIH